MIKVVLGPVKKGDQNEMAKKNPCSPYLMEKTWQVLIENFWEDTHDWVWINITLSVLKHLVQIVHGLNVRMPNGQTVWISSDHQL